jgi:glucose dehydrogenase
MKKIFNNYIVIFLLFFLTSCDNLQIIKTKLYNQTWLVDSYKFFSNIQLFDKTSIFFSDKIELILLKFSNDHKNYWAVENQNERAALPNVKLIHASKNLTKSTNPNEYNFSNWYRSHGNHGSNRFSELDLINNLNVNALDVAWIYNSDKKISVQCNPIIVNGIIYTPSGEHIVALDGYSGSEIWKSKKFNSSLAKRGLIYWEGNHNNSPRIIFSNEKNLVSINAKDGKLIKDFGNNGSVRTGINILAPVIYDNKIIIATHSHKVEVYNLLNGKLEWQLNFREKNYKRIGGVPYNYTGGVPWGGISADLVRGIVYFTTGNPHDYFDGTRRPGNNEDTNSVIAIDIKNKKKLWSFQETAHDIWNLDIPSPPVLTSIKKNSILVDVVVVPTKLGNTLILDRLTGEPIFDYELKKAPTSDLPGEKTSPYQPNIKIPEPFEKNAISINDIRKEHQKKINENYRFGFFETFSVNKKNILLNFHGGAEWTGASVDHVNNIMFVTSNNIPWEGRIVEYTPNNRAPIYRSEYKRLLDESGYPINNPPWGSLTAINLNTGKIIWKEPLGNYKEFKQESKLFTGTENFGGVTATKGNITISTGTLDKKLYIHDSRNGKLIWEKELPYIGSAPPSVYMANQEQFILVQATGGFTLRAYGEFAGPGNSIVAFKLKK